MSASREEVLADWQSLRNEHWPGLLLGNGASIAVWPQFGYASLYEEASSEAAAPRRLTDEDAALFDAFDHSTNFEEILLALRTSIRVADALGEDTSRLQLRYGSIQQALFSAVHATHVPWNQLSGNALEAIRRELRSYSVVYSTNYDLLVYWAILHEGGTQEFVDRFWGDGHSFDPSNTEVWGGRTEVLYLHGGLHLFRRAGGGTAKHVASTNTVLEEFREALIEGVIPVLVSEGSSADKLRSILSSDYLSFAYERFSAHRGPLVIFGHSLSDHDAHLREVMRRWGDRRIAISIPGSAEWEESMSLYEAALPRADLVFFAAETHPLGSDAVRAGGSRFQRFGRRFGRA